MVEEAEVRVPLLESKISVECDCGSELIVDFSKPEMGSWSRIKLECIVCNKEYGEGLRNLFKALSNFAAHFDQSRVKVFFRLREART